MTFKSNIDFLSLTAKGVRVGIIDSGYVNGKREINIADGVDLSNGDIKSDCTDSIGHGTACAGIISKKAPEAAICPVKIFDEELISDVNLLTSAIKWCIDNHINVINMSLGTTDFNHLEELKEICNFASKKNVFIVAAVSNDNQESYPASFPGVFGVTAGKVKKKYDYYYNPSRQVQFIARGDRQRLDWIDNKRIFLGGTSFAAPHVSAIVALILQKYPGISFDSLSNLLHENSLENEPELVDGQEFYTIPGTSNVAGKPQVKLSELHDQHDFKWIKKALIYPYNKEMHSLIRYRDLLPFEIVHIVDVVGKRTIGKDAGEVIGAPDTGIIIKKKFEECLNDIDTIVLGFVDEISRIKKRDVLLEMLKFAYENNKNVYSLFRLTAEHYPDIFKKFKEKGLHITSPLVRMDDFDRITKAFDWQTHSQIPIVGVFGTSPQQGKFTVQLALREELLKNGYKVGQLGTEQQAALFGFDYSFPNGYDDGHPNLRIPMEGHIQFLQSVMAGIEHDKPHIIVVGGQSGLIPYSYAEKSTGYTLSSLQLLFATIPDAYIFLINSIDEFDYVQDNINVIQGIGKGKVILFVFSDKKKEVVSSFGKSSVVQQQLSKSEIEATINNFENRFGIPTTEVISDVGKRKMLTTIENYFSEE